MDRSSVNQISLAELVALPQTKQSFIASTLTPKVGPFGIGRSHRGRDSIGVDQVYSLCLPVSQPNASNGGDLAIQSIGYAVIESKRPLLQHEILYINAIVTLITNSMRGDIIR